MRDGLCAGLDRAPGCRAAPVAPVGGSPAPRPARDERGTYSRLIASIASRSSLDQAQLHVVVLVDRCVAEARDLVVAADHQAQRRGDVLGAHAEVGGALAVDLHAQLGLVELERGVGVDDAAELLRARRAARSA